MFACFLKISPVLNSIYSGYNTFHTLSIPIFPYICWMTPCQVLRVIRYHEGLEKHMDNMILNRDFTIFLYFGMISPVSGIVSYHLKNL